VVTDLFVVDDERHSDLGIVGPLQAFESLLAVALEVPWERKVWRSCVYFRHVGFCQGFSREVSRKEALRAEHGRNASCLVRSEKGAPRSSIIREALRSIKHRATTTATEARLRQNRLSHGITRCKITAPKSCLTHYRYPECSAQCYRTGQGSGDGTDRILRPKIIR
jgi:hypothetical protein